MFENVMAEKKRKGMRPGVSVVEIAQRDHLSYHEAIDKMMRQGDLPPTDPRQHLAPARVRRFSMQPQADVVSAYGRVLEQGMETAGTREDRVRYMAAIRKNRQINLSSASAGEAAAQREKMAMVLVSGNPNDKMANSALELSAGLSDRAQRDYVTRGFDGRNGTIAQAARLQGRSWKEVRDDLVKYDVLKKSDPRRNIRAADITHQYKGATPIRKTLASPKLEESAMKRLRKDPNDREAMGWLAASAAMEGPKKARKVRGSLPPRRSAFDLVGQER